MNVHISSKDEQALALYTPSRRSHLHGLSEPPYRTLRATFTE